MTMDDWESSPSFDKCQNLDNELNNCARKIVVLLNGRWNIKRPSQPCGIGLIHMTYLSCAMEWVNLKGAVKA